MSNRDIKKENEIISNLTGYLANTAIYDSERNRIIEWLNYGGHNRFNMIFDSRDIDNPPFAAIGEYYIHLYECNYSNSNHRECVAFRNKVKKALQTHYQKEKERWNQYVLDRWEEIIKSNQSK